ncbi:MAG: hypothetical protein K9L85_04360 [Candidatus Peribacteraceae bacterium]|nr:hypothetical protein [Candidatus Peribacteraceae bacterium]
MSQNPELNAAFDEFNQSSKAIETKRLEMSRQEQKAILREATHKLLDRIAKIYGFKKTAGAEIYEFREGEQTPAEVAALFNTYEKSVLDIHNNWRGGTQEYEELRRKIQISREELLTLLAAMSGLVRTKIGDAFLFTKQAA